MTFPYTLDTFQRLSVEAIERDENVLVTAHTSAGKSTVAEYAIAKCAQLGKRSIYTSPIKTLSNQKYADFIKHSHNMGLTPDDIGIMTGDVKLKPEASCLVMTTEILRNRLFQMDTRDDFFNDIKMVVFDEVHYINDPDRGHVWEETIMMLPPHILRIMLSASISGADRLAQWVTSLNPDTPRPTPLISTTHRPVPLVHQLFYNHPSLPSPLIDLYRENKFLPDDHSQSFDLAYRDNRNHCKSVNQKSQSKKILFSLVDYLQLQEQFPAIFFCFSRRKCQNYATSLGQVLVDHQTRNQITRTFEFYLVRLLPESQRSINQVLVLKKCVERGIAFHHSGLLPALKEIVEILFSKGWIKILFATETFAVGVNMPARTVVFTSLEKHDDRSWRTLRTDEYIQMSGRAGRRGLDTLGRVIIAPLEDFPDRHTINQVLTSSSPYIQSRLAIDPVLLLQAIDSPSFDIYPLLEKSLWFYQRQCDIDRLEQNLNELQEKHSQIFQKIDSSKIPLLDEYYSHTSKKKETQDKIEQSFQDLGFAVKKKKPKKSKKSKLNQNQNDNIKLQKIIDSWSNRDAFDQDLKLFLESKKILSEITSIREEKSSLESEISQTIETLLVPLETLDFVESTTATPNPTPTSPTATPTTPQILVPKLTLTGKIAARFHECPPLITSVAFQENVFTSLNSIEIVGILAALSMDNSSGSQFQLSHNVIDKSNNPVKLSPALRQALHSLIEIDKKLQETLIDYHPDTLSTEMLWPAISWASGATLTSLREDGCELYEGNLVRQLLKITHMAAEVIEVYQSLDMLDRVQAWDEIEKIMVRDFVKVESVYLI